MSNAQIHITLNGEPTYAAVGCNIDAVLDIAGLVAERRNGIAVAVNQAVVPRSEWSSTAISDGDRIEIVTAVQGG